MTSWARAVGIGSTVVLAACASVPRATGTGPAYPDLPSPSVPATLAATPELRERQAEGWRRLQAGDLRGATRQFTDVLRTSATFYPAETGLGLVALASRQFRPAAARFRAALAYDGRYVPAWQGLVSAELGQNNLDEAAAALERLLALQPSPENRTRLDLLHVRQVQALAEAGKRARDAGRLADAKDAYARALRISPDSAVILRELGLVELLAGDVDPAEVRIRRAVHIDPSDAANLAALAAVFEARGRLQAAAVEYERAVAIDPKWRGKAEASRTAADRDGLPDEVRGLESSVTVTRAQLAALIGVRLSSLLERAPKRTLPVATDTRTHWAAEWIAAVTRAGAMEVYANHTFQPAATVRRMELAQVIARLLPLTGRTGDLTQWQAARPAVPDVPAANVSYRSIALALNAGVMTTDETGQFSPSRPVAGADVVAAVRRLEQLAGR